jgi:NitT/TauT family transport system permease protein
VFFTITLIGLLGFAFDLLFRVVQRRLLYWLPRDTGAALGL